MGVVNNTVGVSYSIAVLWVWSTSVVMVVKTLYECKIRLGCVT